MVIYKLRKSDQATRPHEKFKVFSSVLEALSAEKVEYETRTQTTNIIPGQSFLLFMQYLESLVLQFFKKHEKLGPHILNYIQKSLLINRSLNQQFCDSINEGTGLHLLQIQKVNGSDSQPNHEFERLIYPFYLNVLFLFI